MKVLIRRVILVVVGLFIFMSACIVHPPAHWTLATTALYISAIIGYCGIVLLLVMYSLGTRAVHGLYSDSPHTVLAVHKWLGIYVPILIFIHPILVTIQYGESLFYSVWPQTSSVFEWYVTFGRIALWVLGGTWLISAFLRGKIAYRPWKYLHYGAYVIAPLALLHVVGNGSNFIQHVSTKIFFFSIVIGFIGFSLLRLRTLLNVDSTSYQILEQSMVAHATYKLIVKTDGQALRVKPGQYIYLKTGILSEEHPFSVAYSDGQKLTFLYRRVGRFTTTLSKLPIGSKLSLSPAYGTFTQEAETSTEPIIYIAGGIGCTPFLERLISRQRPPSALIYCNRSPQTTAELPHLRTALGRRLIELYSEHAPPGTESGNFSSSILTQYFEAPSTYRYFVCGPAGFMEHVGSTLAAVGIPRSHISYESFEF
jgi:predicted ferric reductase